MLKPQPQMVAVCIREFSSLRSGLVPLRGARRRRDALSKTLPGLSQRDQDALLGVPLCDRG